MRLLLDMGLAPRTAENLRRLQHDAVHLHDRGLQRLPDPDIVALAVAESRVVVTFDLGFPRILALQKLAAPSVILFRLDKFTTDEINVTLLDLLATYEADLLAGAVIVVDPRQVRIRKLPIF
jgi:predicted nuclease of predicted toxin-antitoxin system